MQFERLFDNDDLVPSDWKTGENGGGEDFPRPSGPQGYRVFNPTLAATPGGYAMAYRVVDEERNLRRLATCSLDVNLGIVPGSVTPLTDLVIFSSAGVLDERARTWHADPRYLRLRGRLYLLWNDGGNKPRNHQFLLELTEDGLRPAGLAREVVRDGIPCPIEKNWMFFESATGIKATYSISPHEILSVDLDHPSIIMCRRESVAEWVDDYENVFGVLRGSAQPVRWGDGFLTLAHSSYKTTGGQRYRACCFQFDGTPPFSLSRCPSRPFGLPNPKGEAFDFPKLNPNVCEVVYPCGFLIEGEDALISYGINDEACMIARLPLNAMLGSMVSARVRPSGQLVDVQAPAEVAPMAMRDRLGSVPLYWWDAKGKKFDGKFGARRFDVGNFGDIASREIVERLGGVKTCRPLKSERKLLAIGSVLHTAENGDIIWGAGVKGSRAEFAAVVKELTVRAVRGPLTVDFLRRNGIDLSGLTHLFDPGCLIALIYEREIAEMRARIPRGSQGIKIIPHFKDDLLLRREHFNHVAHFVSVDAAPLGLIESIIGAELVVSSSLHGIIFAEALGIPACWLAPVGGEDELKYFDYYYGTDRFAVKRFSDLRTALSAKPMHLPQFRLAEFAATFPRDDISALAVIDIASADSVEVSDGGPAQPEARQPIDDDPFSPARRKSIFLHEAQEARKARQRNELLVFLNAAFSCDPSDEQLAYRIARTLRLHNRMDEALLFLRRFKGTDASVNHARRFRLDSELESGNAVRADRIAADLLLKGSESDRAWVKRRRIHIGLELRASQLGLLDEQRPELWKSEDPISENFGDVLNPYIIEKLSGKPPRLVQRGKDVLVIGSGIKFANKDTKIWGSGVSRLGDRLNPEAIYLSVRGPLTRKLIIESGGDCPEVYGDPAWFLPRIYASRNGWTKRCRLGLIQHFHNETELVVAEGVKRITSLCGDHDEIESFIEEIHECECLLTTSLHGLIVAHAYGIPARWCEISDSEFRPEDEAGFHDYMLSVGLDPERPLILPRGALVDVSLVAEADRLPRNGIDLGKMISSAPFHINPAYH